VPSSHSFHSRPGGVKAFTEVLEPESLATPRAAIPGRWCSRIKSKNELDQRMKNSRIALASAAVRAALLLTRFGLWLLPRRHSPPSPQLAMALASLDNAAGAASEAVDEPLPSNGERRVFLDVPFFVDTDAEFAHVDGTDLSNPKGAGAGGPFNFRFNARPRRTRRTINALE
jgi:hypothetical protein